VLCPAASILCIVKRKEGCGHDYLGRLHFERKNITSQRAASFLMSGNTTRDKQTRPATERGIRAGFRRFINRVPA
jgi:hypothetical protein